jgi:hypothetical protein
VTYTKGTVRDCGQSIVQFGGDDRTGICVGTDTSNQPSFCALLFNFATLSGLKLIELKRLGVVTDPYDGHLKIQSTIAVTQFLGFSRHGQATIVYCLNY